MQLQLLDRFLSARRAVPGQQAVTLPPLLNLLLAFESLRCSRASLGSCRPCHAHLLASCMQSTMSPSQEAESFSGSNLMATVAAKIVAFLCCQCTRVLLLQS